ncbi:MAG: PmbA/TldA family metallopeptidase [Holdemania massiliensis]
MSIRIFDGLRTVYGYTNEQDDEKIMAVIDQLAESIGRKRQAGAGFFSRRKSWISMHRKFRFKA